MRIPISFRYPLGTAAAIAVLAGCSNGGSSVAPSGGAMIPQSISRTAVGEAPASWVPRDLLQDGGFPQQRPSWMVEANAKVDLLYAAEYGPAASGKGFYFQYPGSDKGNVKPQCSVATLAVNGIGMDVSGTLYVPEGGSTTVKPSVETFLPNCKKQSLVLTKPSGQPSDIAFDTKKNAYVADIFGASGSTTPGLIDIYPPGHTTPTGQLTNPTVNEALGIAVDNKNNVYLAFLDKSMVGHIVKFAKGKGHGKVLSLTGLSRPIGLEFDIKQNLIVTDLGVKAELIYKPPYSGAPTSTYPDHGTPVEGKLNKTNTLLYVSDVTAGSIDVYKYPGGAYQYSVTNGLSATLNVEGVALDPTAPN